MGIASLDGRYKSYRAPLEGGARYKRRNKKSRCESTRPTTYSVWANLLALAVVYPTTAALAATGACALPSLPSSRVWKAGVAPSQLLR